MLAQTSGKDGSMLTVALIRVQIELILSQGQGQGHGPRVLPCVAPVSLLQSGLLVAIPLEPWLTCISGVLCYGGL